MAEPFIKAGRVFVEDFCWADPEDVVLAEGVRNIHTGDLYLTAAEADRLTCVVESYRHLLTHPAGTESVMRQLRKVRRALKQVSRG